MQIYTKPEAVIFSYPLRSLGDPGSFLFFDIETTGLTPQNAQVYLIGALSYTKEEGWVLRQWFADRMADEEALLRSFFIFASGFRTLVHYNGDHFDLPFLCRCASQYGIENPFHGLSSLDLYRAARPYRKILGTERLNQKSVEQYLGLSRTDTFSGAELIRVYEDYRSSGSTALLQQLLLHNEEDITGLTVLLSLLSYHDFLNGAFSSLQCSTDEEHLRIRAVSASELPVPIRLSEESFTLTISGKELELAFPVIQTTLRSWFPNYRDYYWLPLEGCAVHKSIGEFVDRSCREKATARNAYAEQEGAFIPCCLKDPGPLKLFRRDYRERSAYLLAQAVTELDEAALNTFLTAFLTAQKLRESAGEEEEP